MTEKRRALLGELPRCFKRKPTGASRVDLYPGNYFKCRDDDLEVAAQQREVLPVGYAAAKELRCDDRSPPGVATKLERSKWSEIGARKELPAKELKELRRRSGPRPAGARGVLTSKGPSLARAGLVVLGCQDDKS